MKTVVLTYKGRDSWTARFMKRQAVCMWMLIHENPINRISAQSTRMSLMVNRILRLPRTFRLNFSLFGIHGIKQIEFQVSLTQKEASVIRRLCLFGGKTI